ncbi:DEAD/DEAH box helicase [Stieleria sp. JC731]|uniref:DEAD/DEAH box helicase n=1 Tax=Pirellulaceae TaxID=2691357 RepID=UPI001E6362EF|nr:DEAD/DEAH box helicase [Stieleria sp. JC731]MCC9603460.1 DEAD/DEAH box helicase [Stieleria sp. JC731]
MSNELDMMDEAARADLNPQSEVQDGGDQQESPTNETESANESQLTAEQETEAAASVVEAESAVVEAESAVVEAESAAGETSQSEAGQNEPEAAEEVAVSNENSDSQSDRNEETGEAVSAKSKKEKAASDEPRFRDFELSNEVQLAVDCSGYTTPTEVQQRIIPYILAGRDVLAQSQTGTGKTAAFALPLLSKISGRPKLPQILVLAPTRELATQVAKSFETYGANIPKLQIVALYGGADYDPQLKALKRGVHVVVGTPGRVIDHIKRGTLKLDGLSSVVLDEADEMLNLGFIDDVEWILQQTNQERQIALFSATMPAPIRRVADQYLDDPAVITVRKKTLTADTIEQRCVIIQERSKRELLCRLIEMEDTDGVLVFTKTKDSTVAVADHLLTLGLRAAALNGDLPQARRQKTVDQLKAGRLDILVATDVAARGLDVQRISHVFNYDLPHDSESYVHRIGRTGRAGRKGVAYIFLTPRQRNKLRLIEKVTKQRIELFNPPTKEELTDVRIEQFKREIDEARSHQDLGLFKTILADYVQENGTTLEDAAAALAVLSRRGQPLVAKDLAAVKEPRERRERSFDGDDGPRRRKPRISDRAESGMDRYWIGVGHTDGVRPGNIVGAIANEVGIPGSDIGPIAINETFSTVDLPSGLPDDVIEYLQNTWVSGKQLRIRPFTERRPRDFEGGRKGKPKRGGFKKKSGKNFGQGSYDGPRSESSSGRPGGKPGRSGGKPYGNSGGKLGGKPGGKPFGKKSKFKKKFDRD